MCVYIYIYTRRNRSDACGACAAEQAESVGRARANLQSAV